MGAFFLSLSFLLIILSVLPFFQNQHWVFRVPEFLKLQIFILQIVASVGLFIFAEKNIWFWSIMLIQVVMLVYHAYLLARFTTLYKKNSINDLSSKDIKIISTNIYIFNQKFGVFKEFIRRENPDIFLTIESNKDWEYALRELEKEYPYTEKVTLENTYGMHLYAKLPFQEITTHYFVANDLPSIEAHFKAKEGEDFVVFCVHPPPPSPTEEDTSIERDGDLLCIAKRIRAIDKPVLAIGDFNTVAWPKISDLFRKNSELIDGRYGRGVLASYHAKYWFFRAPLDLVFHCENIFLKELKILEHIGSDHFPVCGIFCVDADTDRKEEVETITNEDEEETEEMIEEGKQEDSENRSS